MINIVTTPPPQQRCLGDYFLGDFSLSHKNSLSHMQPRIPHSRVESLGTQLNSLDIFLICS